MADMRMCSGSPSHTFDVEQHSRCPICNAPPKPIGELHVIKKLLPWLVTAVAVGLAIFAFTHSTDNGNSDAVKKYYEAQKSYENMKKEKENSEKKYDNYKKKFADLEKNYGRSSDKFYASIPIVILKKNGNAGLVPIYSEGGKEVNATLNSKDLGGDMSIKFTNKWNNGWTDLIATPNQKTGYGIIRFTQKSENKSFDVLVVVK